MKSLRPLALSVLLAAAPAAAQTSSQDATFEIGARYWLSTGRTQLAHDAQGFDPTYGNPTSILTYEDLSAQSIELHAHKRLGDGWFIKGNLGAGWVNRGLFDDEDYAAGQVKYSDTTSSVRGHQLAYLTLDAGRTLWSTPGTRVGVFMGFQQWTERADAYGISYTVPPGTPGVGNTTPMVSNEVTWRSFRLGAGARFIYGRMQTIAELALVPYTRMRNEDSHHQRPDLGPVPNVIDDGHGNGAQFDLEVRSKVFEHYELGLGFRYWKLQTTSGTSSLAGLMFPLVHFESERSGVTLSLTRRW